jgi:hypothetical protein
MEGWKIPPAQAGTMPERLGLRGIGEGGGGRGELARTGREKVSCFFPG